MRLTPYQQHFIERAQEEDLWCLHEESGLCFTPDELVERWVATRGPFEGFTYIDPDIRKEWLANQVEMSKLALVDFQLRRREQRAAN